MVSFGMLAGREGPAMRLRLSLFGELGGDGDGGLVGSCDSSACRLRLARRGGGWDGPIDDILEYFSLLCKKYRCCQMLVFSWRGSS